MSAELMCARGVIIPDAVYAIKVPITQQQGYCLRLAHMSSLRAGLRMAQDRRAHADQ